MPPKNSTLNPQPNITPILRKSLRLLLKNKHPPLEPKTPEPRSRICRFYSDRSPLSSVDKGSVGKANKNIKESKCGLMNLGNSNHGLVGSGVENSGFGVRRSSRLSGKVNLVNEFLEMKVRIDLGKGVDGKSVIKKRETRSSNRRNADEIAKKSNECKKGLSDAERAKPNLRERNVRETKIEKRVTHGSIQGCADEITKRKCKGIEDSLGIERSSTGANSGVDLRGNLGKELIRSCGSLSAVIDEVNTKERGTENHTKTIGVKRKRNQDEENHGWTQDQELALQTTYFAAKPTPNFWKRVSKLVPGKSAQDCFNKVHADSLTPPQPRPRSRATKKVVSSFSLSASKLIKPEDSKKSRKQKGHLAQKTVRQLLEKHYNVDQGHEADLFSVLEPTFNPSISYSTPKSGKGTSGSLKTCFDKSTSALKKPFSRIGCSNGKVFVSPPVLKPVKNKALHEKYIDQLHCREAKRRKISGKNNAMKVINQKTESIKVLKDALVLDAKDFIHKFEHRSDSATVEYSDDGNVNEGVEEDEF